MILMGIHKQSKIDSRIVMEAMYEMLDTTRQAFNQSRTRQLKESKMMLEIENIVSKYRATKDQRAGSRSLYHNLHIKESYGLGINKFERLMSKYMLTLSVLRVMTITTRTCSRSKMYTNELNGLVVWDINKVVVGDITYVFKDNIQYYVFTLFDIYSGRMVGIYGGKRMRSIEALIVLDQLILLRGVVALMGCIHHTDGGGQYFSNKYNEKISKMEMQYSVASTCLENGYAEQRNGLIKGHFLALKRGRNEYEFNKGLLEIQADYNQRKQQNLGWLSPLEIEENIKYLKKEERTKMVLHDFTN
jgi:putative transposase